MRRDTYSEVMGRLLKTAGEVDLHIVGESVSALSRMVPALRVHKEGD